MGGREGRGGRGRWEEDNLLRRLSLGVGDMGSTGYVAVGTARTRVWRPREKAGPCPLQCVTHGLNLFVNTTFPFHPTRKLCDSLL